MAQSLEGGRGRQRGREAGDGGGTGVDGLVHAHHVHRGGVVLVEAHHDREVRGPVVALIQGDEVAVLVRVAVDGGGEARELAEEVQRVLKDGLPVLGLVDACIGSGTVVRDGSDGAERTVHHKTPSVELAVCSSSVHCDGVSQGRSCCRGEPVAR